MNFISSIKSFFKKVPIASSIEQILNSELVDIKILEYDDYFRSYQIQIIFKFYYNEIHHIYIESSYKDFQNLKNCYNLYGKLNTLAISNPDSLKTLIYAYNLRAVTVNSRSDDLIMISSIILTLVTCISLLIYV